MKSFLKSRWHHLPLGIITVIMLVCLVAGSAFAAFTFWTATAEVTVNEAITVGPPIAAPGPNDGTWDKALTEWSISLYPGESGNSYLSFNNASSADITVTPSVALSNWPASGNNGEVTCTFDAPSYVVPGGGNEPFMLTVAAGVSSVPGPYTFQLSVER